MGNAESQSDDDTSVAKLLPQGTPTPKAQHRPADTGRPWSLAQRPMSLPVLIDFQFPMGIPSDPQYPGARLARSVSESTGISELSTTTGISELSRATEITELSKATGTNSELERAVPVNDAPTRDRRQNESLKRCCTAIDKRISIIIHRKYILLNDDCYSCNVDEDSCEEHNHGIDEEDSGCTCSCCSCLKACIPGPVQRHAKKVKETIFDYDDFSRFDILLLVASVLLYFVDIGSDIKLVVDYFTAGHPIYAVITLLFVVAAYVVIFVYGMQFYRANNERKKRRVVFLFLGLWHITLTLEYLTDVIRLREKRREVKEQEKLSKVDRDFMRNSRIMARKGPVAISMMRLLEGFIEAAPQVCFQLYIVFREQWHGDIIPRAWAVAVLSSWLSLAMSVAIFYKQTRKHFAKLPMKSLVVYYLWRVCETGCRLLCIALFASRFGNWVFLILGFHFLAMYAWYLRASSHTKPGLHDLWYGFLMSYVMLFTMFTLTRPSRYVYIIFYAIFYVENFVMIAFWAATTSQNTAWFYYPVILASIVFFIAHIVLQIVFYKVFHQKAESAKCSLSWDWKQLRRSSCFWL